MNAERKFKDAFDLQPDALVILSSNLLWSPKDASTGLQRRIIYLPFNTIPEKINRQLFSFDLTNNVCSGTLSKSLPGLVNWALENTTENLNLLNNAIETNKLINPYIIRETNPLVDWIKSYISFEDGQSAYIGRKSSNPKNNLYPNYLQFCKEHNFPPLNFQSFGSILLQQLNIILNKSIQKKITSGGFVFTNIKLEEETIVENPAETTQYNILDEFQ